MRLNLVKAYPPNYDQICEAIDGVKGNEGIVFTYGDTVYSPSGIALAEHVRRHEAVHVEQQTKMGKDEWWAEYLKNPQFRLEQELEAYKVQYRWIQRTRNYKYISETLDGIAADLAGPMYGNILDFDTAKKAISKK